MLSAAVKVNHRTMIIPVTQRYRRYWARDLRVFGQGSATLPEGIVDGHVQRDVGQLDVEREEHVRQVVLEGWAEPAIKGSRAYDISGTALAKICRMYRVMVSRGFRRSLQGIGPGTVGIGMGAIWLQG